jgi:hypothetical protein
MRKLKYILIVLFFFSFVFISCEYYAGVLIDIDEGKEWTLSIDIQPDNAGEIIIDPDKDTYTEGEEVQLQAQASVGYAFGKWEHANGDFIDEVENITITMDSNKSIIAYFDTLPSDLTLTIEIDPIDRGTVGINPANDYYYQGEEVILTPMPNTGYMFNSWNGNISPITDNDNGTYTLIMDNNEVIVANFDLKTHQVDTAFDFGLTVGVEIDAPIDSYDIGLQYYQANGSPLSMPDILDQTQIIFNLQAADALHPGYMFDGFNGPNGGEVVNQGDGTYILIVDGYKDVSVDASPEAGFQELILRVNDYYNDVNAELGGSIEVNDINSNPLTFTYMDSPTAIAVSSFTTASIQLLPNHYTSPARGASFEVGLFNEGSGTYDDITNNYYLQEYFYVVDVYIDGTKDVEINFVEDFEPPIIDDVNSFYASDTMTIVFNEFLDTNFIPSNTVFDINGSSLTQADISSINVINNVMEIIFLITITGTPELVYTGTSLRDYAGNEVANFNYTF